VAGVACRVTLEIFHDFILTKGNILFIMMQGFIET